jgi:hypothetical protein
MPSMTFASLIRSKLIVNDSGCSLMRLCKPFAMKYINTRFFFSSKVSLAILVQINLFCSVVDIDYDSHRDTQMKKIDVVNSRLCIVIEHAKW